MSVFLVLAISNPTSIVGQEASPIELSEKVQQLEQARVDAISRATRSAVGVFGPGGQGGGSGVVVTPDGYALTNYHVIRSCGSFMKCSMSDGVLYDAVIVGIDPVGDVAVIKMLGRDDFPVAAMADSDQVKVGNYCFAVGNPFLLATDFQPTVSWGIVSGTHRYQYPSGTLLEYADCIQTDAAINPGNSGGPLFDGAGRLIGINGRGSFEKRGRVNVGVGYAISINQIKHFMDHLLAGRLVDHATLGATVSTNDAGEVRVSDILESSDAYQRGLRYDDQLVRFGGRDIQTTNQFKNVLGIYPKGWRVPLTYRRKGKDVEIEVRLTGVHATERLVEMIQGGDKKRAPEIPVPDRKPNPKPSPQRPNPKRPKQQPERGPDGQPPVAESKVPDQYKHLFEKKYGYVNYYFNRLNRDRVWDGFIKSGDFTQHKLNWRLTGTDEQGGEVTIVLGDDQSGIQSVDGTSVLESGEGLAAQMQNDATGFLVAMHLWRRLLVNGPETYGEVYYLGSVPSFSTNAHVDVLVGTFDVSESNFMFDKASQKLVAIEMFTDVQGLPHELSFADFQVDGELTVPGKIRYQYGDLKPVTIQIEKIEFTRPVGESQQ